MVWMDNIILTIKLNLVLDENFCLVCMVRDRHDFILAH